MVVYMQSKVKYMLFIYAE